MKVLILSSLFPNPIKRIYGTFVYESAKELRNECELTIISPVVWVPPIKYLFGNLTNLSRIPKAELLDVGKVYHQRYIALPRRYLFSAWGISYYLSCLRVLCSVSPDLIHAHQVYPDGYAACMLGNKVDKPVIITIHGELSNAELQAETIRRKVRYALNRADRVVIIGKYQEELCASFGLEDPRKLVNIANGFDRFSFFPSDRVQDRIQLGISTDVKMLCYVGHLYPPKGLSYLIKAMGQVVSRCATIVLYIIGDGPIRDELIHLTDEAGLTANIFFVGQKERAEVRRWMSAADLFVLPSVKEGFPTVLPEALACGTPVISTRIYGIPDIIHDGQNGALVPPADSDALAEAIISGIDKHWERDEIAHRAQAYSWQSISRRLIDCYRDVLAEHRRQS